MRDWDPVEMRSSMYVYDYLTLRKIRSRCFGCFFGLRTGSIILGLDGDRIRVLFSPKVRIISNIVNLVSQAVIYFGSEWAIPACRFIVT